LGHLRPAVADEPLDAGDLGAKRFHRHHVGAAHRQAGLELDLLELSFRGADLAHARRRPAHRVDPLDGSLGVQPDPERGGAAKAAPGVGPPKGGAARPVGLRRC
jgi:hypothetical protein